jgi:hypothetical protein
MAYKPFKVDVIKVLQAAYTSAAVQDKLSEFAIESEFKQLFGIRMVDRIVERTRDLNKDKNNKNFPAYSDRKGVVNYKDSLIFQIYGKSSDVDLTLTGAMLESLNADSGSGRLIIIDVSEDQKGKAEGNIKGSYGKSRSNSKLARDFLGLPEKEINKLFKESMQDYRSGAFSEILV